MAAAQNWMNTAMAGYNYYHTQDDANAGRGIFQPNQSQLKTGFYHWTSGVRYFARGSETDTRKLLQFQIDDTEARIAADTKQLTDLRKAQELVTNEPEFLLLLDLHKKGYL